MKAKQHERAESTAKIDSPLAKYNNLGQLICVVCKAIVKSESLWPSHCAAAGHKNNLMALKEAQKRKREENVEPQPKPKKIKQQEPPSVQMEPPVVELPFEDLQTSAPEPAPEKEAVIPDGFFDSKKQEAQAIAHTKAVRPKSVKYRSKAEKLEEEAALQALLQPEVKPQAIIEEEEIIDVVELVDAHSLLPLNENPTVLFQPTTKPTKINTTPVGRIGFRTETFDVAPPIDEPMQLIFNEMEKDDISRRETLNRLNELKNRVQKIQRPKSETQKVVKAKEQPKLEETIVEAEDDEEDLWRSGSIL